MSEAYCVTFILYLSSTDRLIVARLAVHGRGDEYKIGCDGSSIVRRTFDVNSLFIIVALIRSRAWHTHCDHVFSPYHIRANIYMLLCSPVHIHKQAILIFHAPWAAHALHALNPKLDAMYDRYDTGYWHRRAVRMGCRDRKSVV